jgi:hypothetical protein
VVVNAFTMSIQTVADRVWYAGTNDSFVKEFWNRRVNITQVVTEMAAQVLIHNVGAWAEPCAAACLMRAMLTRTPPFTHLPDRCTKNHVRWPVASAFRMRALTLSYLLVRCMRTSESQTSGSSSHKTLKTVSPRTRVTATAAAQRKAGLARCGGAACAWLRMAACVDASCGLLQDAYCYLSCPDFNSVFMCDKDHPQDHVDRSTFNHLTSAVLWNPETKALYFSSLKLMLAKCVGAGMCTRGRRAG